MFELFVVVVLTICVIVFARNQNNPPIGREHLLDEFDPDDNQIVSQTVPSSSGEPDVLFFPDAKLPCSTFYKYLESELNFRCHKRVCENAHLTDMNGATSLMRILLVLKAALKTIDLCIYNFTHEKLAESLIRAKKREVQVRIITDAHLDREHTQNDQIPRLQEHGIQVRLVRPGLGAIPGLMHNKFVLIDSRCLLTGSFNWTHSAVLRNHEAVIKTYEQQIVRPFREKFNDLWMRSVDRPQGAAQLF